MSQLFRPSVNVLAKLSIVAAIVTLGGGLGLGVALYRSPFATNVGINWDQPVPFPHEHHVAGLGIDCRYCHISVEDSPYAGIPATQVCMNCHSQVWNEAPMLEPVRASWRTGESIQWTKVHRVADFVYFNHATHINKGIGCNECHGRVDQMSLTHQAINMTMEWCLSCHMQPELFVRPRSEVFNMAYERPADQAELGKQLVADYHIQSKVNCSTCHR